VRNSKEAKDRGRKMSTFGEILKQHRKKARWSQERLGGILTPKRPKGFISNVERGVNGRPGLTCGDLCEMALALGILPRDLITPFVRDFGLLQIDPGRSIRAEERVDILADALTLWHVDPWAVKEALESLGGYGGIKKKGPRGRPAAKQKTRRNSAGP
jgi:transcriptional regulator with XRE-family HTH domain